MESLEDVEAKQEREATIYRSGFEHAIRNCLAALNQQIHAEHNEDRKLGLQIARQTVANYRAFLKPKPDA